MDVLQQIRDIEQTTPVGTQLCVSGFNASASVNRNYCLDRSNAEYIVMLDDDITGFTYGWADRLVKTLFDNTDVVMVSARLMNDDGTFGTMMDIAPNLDDIIQVVDHRYLPSACIAFRRDTRLRFDENFIGSGWEDTDFCDTMHKLYPNGLFVINNKIQLIHRNEMKNGNSDAFRANKNYYMNKHKRRA
jgi:glycosyltransferase involved in cell wall biosynthesis